MNLLLLFYTENHMIFSSQYAIIVRGSQKEMPHIIYPHTFFSYVSTYYIIEIREHSWSFHIRCSCFAWQMVAPHLVLKWRRLMYI